MNNIQSIFSNNAPDFIASNHLSIQQVKAINSISFCKTPSMGSHLLSCDDCGHNKVVFNSCGNRHCPSCGSFDKEKWVYKQQESLLPVHYFHLVFTVPDTLRPLIFANQKLLFNLLYSSVSKTILELSKDKLGVIPGFSLVLHTWGQNLMFHPHIHCILVGGGLSTGSSHFRTFKKKFFIHVKVLSKVFKGKSLDSLKIFYSNGDLKFLDNASHLMNSYSFKPFIDSLYDKDWVVFSKSVFKSADHVIKYLGRYTRRVAISDYRIKRVTDNDVTFSYKDNKDKGRMKLMTVSTSEFMRRYLLHVLPHRFVKIRHYGFLSNRFRSSKVALCRKFIAKQKGVVLRLLPSFDKMAVLEKMIGKDKLTCPICGNYYTFVHHALCVNRS